MSGNKFICTPQQVESVEDECGGLRIKVRIDPEDRGKDLSEIPYCFPLLPKHMHVNPQEGETVLVIMSAIDNLNGNRFFIGPVISQQYNLDYEDHDWSARCLLQGKHDVSPLPDPSLSEAHKGVIPPRDAIAMLGRKNTAIWQMDNELRMLCGHITPPTSSLVFNSVDLAYIQMKFLNKNGSAKWRSAINVVADRVNLLTHDSRDDFKLCNPEDLITDEELGRIVKEAHPVVLGDTFMSHLVQIIRIFQNHVHAFPGDPPAITVTDNETLNRDLGDFLSQGVRVN